MYKITKSMDVDFAHHVSGHMGKCINIHGHTWKFEVTLKSSILNHNGFVVDFGELKKKVLEPVKELLDHSFVIAYDTFAEIEKELMGIGRALIATRVDHEPIDMNILTQLASLNGCIQWYCGGITVTTFPFSPTSERLAWWLYDTAKKACILDLDVTVDEAKVYEQLHPVEAYAVYRGEC